MSVLVNGARALIGVAGDAVIGTAGGIMRTATGAVIGVAPQWGRVGAGAFDREGKIVKTSVALLQATIEDPHFLTCEGPWKGVMVHDLTGTGGLGEAERELALFLKAQFENRLAACAITRREADFYVQGLGLWPINSGNDGALFFPRGQLGRKSWHLGPYV